MNTSRFRGMYACVKSFCTVNAEFLENQSVGIHIMVSPSYNFVHNPVAVSRGYLPSSVHFTDRVRTVPTSPHWRIS